MTDTKTFTAADVLAVTSEVATGGDYHQLIAWVLNADSIMISQLAEPEPWALARTEIYRQHPNIRDYAESFSTAVRVSKERPADLVRRTLTVMVERYGDAFVLERGTGTEWTSQSLVDIVGGFAKALRDAKS